MDWHRLFGLVLIDFFTGSPFVVELEKDLSLKQQFLDVLILRRRKGRFQGRLPDGFENLADHNLITFKSHQEALDDWALKELTGHYVNYRKQVSPGDTPLLPESEFGLYAVCARFPHNLDANVSLEKVQQGVYQCRRGTDVIRVIVVGELPQDEHNAPLHLFSAAPRLVQFGQEHYEQRCDETSTLLRDLFGLYQEEGFHVSYTMQDYRRDVAKRLLQEMTPAERLEGLSPEERLEGLSPEEIEKCLERIRQKRSSSPEKPRGQKPRRGKPKR